MLVASTDIPARQEGRTHAPGLAGESSAGFQLALMVPPASVPFLRTGQPATQRRLRWTQVDEQEHSASPETPASGETAPAAGQTPVTEPRAVTGTATGPARE